MTHHPYPEADHQSEPEDRHDDHWYSIKATTVLICASAGVLIVIAGVLVAGR